MANYMAQVAKMLDLKIGEPFRITEKSLDTSPAFRHGECQCYSRNADCMFVNIGLLPGT